MDIGGARDTKSARNDNENVETTDTMSVYVDRPPVDEVLLAEIVRRIVGVADVAEAMVNPRPYRGGLGIDAMLGELRRRRGTAYDSQAVDACVKIVGGRNFPLVIASPALELAD